jgi:hypothetical protein
MNGSRYIVLRFERTSDYGIGGVAAHGKRKGKVPNVDPERTDENQFLIGHADLRALCDERIVKLQKKIVRRRIESLRKSRHTKKRKDLEAALEAAGDDKHALAELVGLPWDDKNVKPWTQGVLSASHEFFQNASGDVDPAKTEEFLSFAKAYLETEFGSEVLYARADLDEKTPHVHFVVAPEHEERRTGNPMLSHHQHRLFGQIETIEGKDEAENENLWRKRSYELFQDRVANFAEAFDIDLRRGKNRVAGEREQIARGEEVSKRKNTRPSRGRDLAAMLVADATDESAKLLFEAEELEAAAKTKNRKAEDKVAEAQRKEREADALMVGMTRGLEALEQEEIAYKPASETRGDGLTYGPKAPKEERARKALRDTIRPAYERLVGFARKLFERMSAIEIQEAENRRVATELAAEDRRVRGQHSNVLERITKGLRPDQYTGDDFPDAFRVPLDMTDDALTKTLANMSNRELKLRHGASLDAANLTEDDPDLAVEYGRGAQAIELVAGMRGFDLETGRHDPDKATDPALAHQHTDGDPEPIKEGVKTRSWQQVR